MLTSFARLVRQGSAVAVADARAVGCMGGAWRWSSTRAAVLFAILTLLLVPVFLSDKAELFLVGVLGVVFAAWLIQKPYWGVLIIFAAWFIRLGWLAYAVSALLLIPLAAILLQERRVAAFHNVQVKTLLAIGALYVLSTWWNDYIRRVSTIAAIDETSLQLSIFVVRLVFIVLVFYFVRTPRDVSLLVWLVVGLIASAAVSGLQPVLAGGVARAHSSFSLAANANRLAHICLFATSLLWFYRSHSVNRRLRQLTLPLLLLLPVTALTTASRSGLLQMVVLGVMVLKEQDGWSAAKRLRSIVFVASVALVVVAAVPAAQLMRATTFNPSTVHKGQDSLKNRFNTVVVAADVVANNPILGVGIGNFTSIKRMIYGLPRRENMHNSYLWALVSGGIGALVLYLYLFYTTYRTLRRLERTGPREFLWLSKALRVNLILFLLFSTFADFWLSEIFALVVALPIALSCVAARQARMASSVVAGASPTAALAYR